MTTYNTYQEAKIANPEYAIFEYQGNFGTDNEILNMFDIQSREMKECKPANHCMTVEKFLADGHKFVKGDVVVDAGEVGVIETEFDIDAHNEPYVGDDKRYILRAAVLEEKPTPTKFVKVEESIFDLKEEFERGELYSSDCEGHYTQLKCKKKLYLAAHQDSVYRQVEIDWRDEVKKLDESALFHDGGDLFLIIDSNSNDFISMCHEIASLTEKPTN